WLARTHSHEQSQIAEEHSTSRLGDGMRIVSLGSNGRANSIEQRIDSGSRRRTGQARVADFVLLKPGQNWRPRLGDGARQVHWLEADQRQLRVRFKYALSARATGEPNVLGEDAAQPNFLLLVHEPVLGLVINCFAADEFAIVVSARERAAQRINKATGHAGAKIVSRGSQNDHDAGGHILTTVLADALHHRQRAAIANGEPLARASGDVELAAGGAVEYGVPREHISSPGCLRSGAYRNRSAAQTLADVVVGFAAKAKAQTRNQERAKTLSRDAAELAVDHLVSQPLEARAAQNLAAQVSTDRAI